MLVAGLMSGTSLDGMDAALLRCSNTSMSTTPQSFQGVSIAFSAKQRKILSQAICDALRWQFNGPQPSSFAPAADLLAQIGIDAIDKLLKTNHLTNADLTAIGFHGQTVLHLPPTGDQFGKTMQIGDAKKIANNLNCKVVHDFRSADMAAGGHGAPLAPAWHFELAKKLGQTPFAFVNIGGVSNITFVPSLSGDAPKANMISFDCGPGNGPLDAWIQSHDLGLMDKDGMIASQGAIDHQIVEANLKSLPQMGKASSFDRWAFNHKCVEGLSVSDGAATLLEITAQAIARGLQALPAIPAQVLIGGGGRLNLRLMRRLNDLVPANINACEAVGLNGDLIEAEAFAWLAFLRLKQMPASWPGTTGVTRPIVAGIICEICD